MLNNRIGIIGSINTDIVCQTNKLPKVGETVIGTNFLTSFGGKGANEAVAASRLQASVNLLGCVGDDDFSKLALANLQKEGVHITAIEQLENTKGGIANIVVCDKNNQIIVIPGANNLVSKEYITKYTSRLLECNIVGCQFEVPIESLILASQICKQNNIQFVLNPSPLKDYPQELFDNATYVIVNEVEIASIQGYNKKKPLNILKQYPNKLILTCGSKGCYFSDGNTIQNIPALDVNVVDTTGAGDTFLGAFMVAINNNMTFLDAVTFANICAGIKTTKLGAQTGMPTLDEVKQYILTNNIDLKL